MTFTALREAGRPRLRDLAILGLDAAPGVYLGVDSDRMPHLLLAQRGKAMPAVGVATLDIDVRTLVIAGEAVEVLDIGCGHVALEEVFDHFVVAVLERMIAAEHSAARIVEDVLSKWQLFLTPSADPPSRDTLAAVFGELLIVLDVVRCDARRRLDVWAGPFGARHDLRRGAVAVEVKTSRAHTSRIVTIHGEDQLEPPEEASLYLHLVRLEDAAEHGRSVPSLVDELLSLGVTPEELFGALARARVPVADLSEAAKVTFDIRERLTFPVDETTPRITRSSFICGERPVGVVDLTYRIDLDHCINHVLDQYEYQALIDSIATSGAG